MKLSSSVVSGDGMRKVLAVKSTCTPEYHSPFKKFGSKKSAGLTPHPPAKHPGDYGAINKTRSRNITVLVENTGLTKMQRKDNKKEKHQVKKLYEEKMAGPVL